MSDKLSGSWDFFITPSSILFTDMGTSAKMTYIVLCYHANRKTREAFPAAETIAKEAGISRSTVFVALSELITKGFLKRQSRKGTSTLYTLLEPTMSKLVGIPRPGAGRPPVRQLDTPRPAAGHPPSGSWTVTRSTELDLVNKNHSELEKESPPAPVPVSPPKKATTIFTKPTLQEVRAYCLERSNRVNAEQFIDHYESCGWMVGRNRMKDWKAAVRTWERNDFGNGRSGPKLKVHEHTTFLEMRED